MSKLRTDCRGPRHSQYRVRISGLLVTIKLSCFAAMPASLQIAPPISAWSGMTPLEDFVTHRTRQSIKELEEQLVAALYQQRHWEEQIMTFSPQSSAPSNFIQSFTQSKLLVQDLERRIRLIRHSF